MRIIESITVIVILVLIALVAAGKIKKVDKDEIARMNNMPESERCGLYSRRPSSVLPAECLKYYVNDPK